MISVKLASFLYLDLDIFDPPHSRYFEGGHDVRGGMPYIIPDKKYYKEALKVKGKFDNGDDSWLKMDGNNNWAIAFHGLRTDVRNIVSLIAINGLKVGQN